MHDLGFLAAPVFGARLAPGSPPVTVMCKDCVRTPGEEASDVPIVHSGGKRDLRELHRPLQQA
jgi:hypothetical protein